MPVPKNKDKCFSHMKAHHPKGVGDVDDVNKQRQAICLGGKGKKKKKTTEGITFKEYLEGLE